MIKLEIREVELKTQTSHIHTPRKLKQCIIHYNVNSQKYQKSLFVDYKINILLERNSINNYTIKVDLTDPIVPIRGQGSLDSDTSAVPQAPRGGRAPLPPLCGEGDAERGYESGGEQDRKIKGLLESKLNNLIKGLLSNHKKAMTLNGVGYWIKFNKNLNSSKDPRRGSKDLSKPLNKSVTHLDTSHSSGSMDSQISESVYVEMNIGYKNSIKKEIPKDIIVYIGNESNIDPASVTLQHSPQSPPPGGSGVGPVMSQNNKSRGTGKVVGLPNELVCESHDLDKLTNWMNSIKQLKPSYKDKYKQKGWSNVYSWKEK